VQLVSDLGNFFFKSRTQKLHHPKSLTNRLGRSPHYTGAPPHWNAAARTRTAVVRALHRIGAPERNPNQLVQPSHTAPTIAPSPRAPHHYRRTALRAVSDQHTCRTHAQP